MVTAIGVAILVGLGVWQLERKAWKEALIGRLTARLSAEPVRLPSRPQWPALDPKDAEFRRITFTAEFLHDQEALVYSAGSALRPDVGGPGFWVLTPARLAGGSLIMVNRGFIPEARRDPATRPEGQVQGVIDITGVMRWPEPRGAFTPADDPDRNLWFLRDHLAIAEAKKLGPVAPFYVDQEGPLPPGGLPSAAPLRLKLPNNHGQYAATWFALAFALVAICAFWVRRRPQPGPR